VNSPTAEIVIICAMAANRVIGRDNRIPWHIPGELARFRKTTMGYPLIMGRRTFESIGRPLDGRRNIVLTRSVSFTAPGIETANSLHRALEMASDGEKVFIIGGALVYREAISLADTMILTILDAAFAGDTLFPNFSHSDFTRVANIRIEGDPGYRVETWQRT